jgi:hypothetical protein
MTVLDFQHLAEPATRFERADDSIAHWGAREGVLRAVQFVGRGKQPLFFIGRNPAIAFRLTLGFDFDAKPVEWR